MRYKSAWGVDLGLDFIGMVVFGLLYVFALEVERMNDLRRDSRGGPDRVRALFGFYLLDEWMQE